MSYRNCVCRHHYSLNNHLILFVSVCHDGSYIDVDSNFYVVAGGLGSINTLPDIFDNDDDRIYEHFTTDNLQVGFPFCSFGSNADEAV